MVNLRAEVRKKLWGSAGNRCAFGSAGNAQRVTLKIRIERAARIWILGEEAHICPERSALAGGSDAVPVDAT